MRVGTAWGMYGCRRHIVRTGVMGGDQTYGLKHHAVGVPVPYQKVMNGKIQSLPYNDWMDVGAIP